MSRRCFRLVFILSGLVFLVRGKNCPDGKNCPGVRYSENNSATRATIHKLIGVCESSSLRLSCESSSLRLSLRLGAEPRRLEWPGGPAGPLNFV